MQLISHAKKLLKRWKFFSQTEELRKNSSHLDHKFKGLMLH